MKYITLIIGLLVMGCGKQEKAATDEPRKLTAEEEKAVGTYEYRDEITLRTVLLENGVSEAYRNGKKLDDDKWSISKDGELHIANKDGDIAVCSINKDKSITIIALIEDGKRTDFPKDKQMTLKKIK